VARFLLDLLAVETIPGPDVERVRANEQRVFDRIAQEVERVRGSREGLERVPIDPCIQCDLYFTPAHYTKTVERPKGLSTAETYRGRANLVLRVPGQGRGVVAFNAHVDTVAPFLAPRFENGVIYGRGACDDKGQVAGLLLALEVIERARRQGLVPPADLLFEFVIDEEPGGNGSLSLALDRRFAFDAIVVFEGTKLGIYPGNRGAVWYKLELNGSAVPGVDLVALAADIVLELEREGAAIKAESDHPLFPHRPVQTCHGVLGPWGKHPSAVNDHVEVVAVFVRVPEGDRLRAVIEQAIADYVATYGDKTKEADPATGRPKVDHHYDLAIEGAAARLVLHGKAGHMGAAAQCDNAIIKAAYVVRRVGAAFGAALRQQWAMGNSGCPLILEGGQGFLPTHPLAEVTERLTQAAGRAAREHCSARGLAYAPRLVRMTYEKLHNEAFARDPNGPGVRAFVASARAVGLPVQEPLRGWDVSCDARIFAREYPEADIITFGPGALEDAHSPSEQVRVDDLARGAMAVAHWALTYAPGEEKGVRSKG
jgi:acetylornithine deacetylase/succinyl-diaminopimelate desuccinylase-like protein